MATKKPTVKLDENESYRMTRKLVTVKEEATKNTRRPALGELGNRVLRSTTTTATSKDVKKPDYKNVRPRVDTFWKKSDLPVKKPVVEEIKQRYEVVKVIKTEKLEVVTAHVKPKSPRKIVQEAPLAQPESDLEQSSAESTSHSNQLIGHVVDIDDNIELLNFSEYAKDVYEYLKELEGKFPIKQNYLENHKDITPKMRQMLLDWINEVHHQFHLTIETYHMAVALIDRYLQVTRNISRKMLQLVGISALFVASKYEEVVPPYIYDFVHITDNSYTDKQVRQMEQSILHKLKFNMGRPLSIHFLRRYSRAADATDIIHGAAKYFIELASIEYSMVHHAPSLIAAAALYLSLQIFEKTDNVWTPTLMYYSNYYESDLESLTKELANLVLKAPSCNLQAVYKKYQGKKAGEIAKMPELSEGIIEEIANKR